MNRIYKTIWNKATGTYVAVSELVGNSGGGQATVASGAAASFAGFCVKALSAALLFAVGNMTLGSVAYAAPLGGTVTNGTAHISSGGTTTTINQTSQNTTINWQSFGINKGETVNFVQPNSNAVALNRVLGNSASAIYGTLNANGKVFLINPNGILFGSGASVNVGGLVASTLNLSDADFMAGKYHLTGTSSASVQNDGSITAANGGYVAMLGANVSNQGIITAKMGTVALAGGQDITLDVAGDGLLNVAVNQGAVNALVQNGGLIKADGGQVMMTAQAAGQLLNTVVNNTGVIEVKTLNGKTGSIKLLGDMSSGTVNVGGTLDASAPNGGNGGAIETSAAHVKVANDAVVTTMAANGLNGSWLIDPTDFTIAASGGDLTGAALSTSLASTNVIILTGTGGTGLSGTNGDIFVNDAVSWSANSTLTLNAWRNININNSITSSGATGKLALLYGQGALAASNTAVYNVSAPVNLVAGANFSTKLGSDGALKNYTVITALGAAGSVTGTDLQGIGGGLTGNYVLGANIDATATSGWNSNAGFTPIGNNTTNFTGTFDGLGHTISNLTINRPTTSGVGLFGYTSSASVIRNVGMVGGSVTGSQYGGGLVGYNNGTISNSYATGTVSGSSSSWNIGGLVGLNNKYNSIGTISNSYATGAVSGTNRAGGLVGNNNGGTISNSYATGAVSGTTDVGGLMGVNNSTNSGIGTISNSYATGAVSGTTDVGGLVGMLYTSTISNSYATGGVSGSSRVGGLVGYDVNNSTISNSYATGGVSGGTYVGGLAGWIGGGGITISNSYATGSVSGTSSVGGLVGYNSSGTISSSYWDSSANATGIGGGTLTGATGLTTTAMQTASNFVGFDFTTTPVWGMVSGKNNNMPVLCVFGGCAPVTTTVYIDPVTGFSTYGTAPVFTYSVVNSSGSVISLTNASTTGTAGYSSSAPTASSNAGSYSFSYLSGLSLIGTGASNYTLAPYATTTSWTVNPAALSVTANSAAKAYGAALPTLGMSYSGFVNGDAASSLTTAATAATTATASSSVGSYATTASGAADPNYVFTYVNGLLTVNAVSQTFPLASVYSPTTTVLVDGSTMAGNDITSEMPLSVGSDVGIKRSTDQAGAFDGTNLQIINGGINLPKNWIISQVSDNAQ